jgi:hypothetical protein
VRRAPSLVAAAITALAVGTTFAIASGGDSAQDPSASGDAGADQLAVEGVAPGLPSLVSAFRRTQLVSDKIPGGDASLALEQTGDAQPGENPNLARRLQPGGGGEAFVWPMSNGVCYQWSAAIACNPTATLEKEGASVGVLYTRGNPSELDVFILVRDGIGEVDIALQDGKRFARVVQDNAVRVTVTEQPTEVRFTQPDGTEGVVAVPKFF